MLLSLSLMILVGLTLSEIFKKLRIPHIIGYIITGILLGPFVLNLIDINILNISADLRQIALIVILLRAGLSLNIEDLKRIGRPALFMAFIPATFEIVGIVILGSLLFNLTLVDSLILGSILAAVSPAVVIPKMLKLMEENKGTEKKIPQLILSGASVDDIYVIVLFTSFISFSSEGTASIMTFISLPISILLGILIGIIVGYLLSILFKKYHVRDTLKVLFILSISFLLVVFEKANIIPFSGLIAVMSLGITILAKYQALAQRLVKKYEKVWIFSELLLFILVGAAVDITLIPNIGFTAIIMIFGALIFRAIGVYISLLKTDLNYKERLFVIISYIPKATVQASIGSIPLSLGLNQGSFMLTVAVLAILLTAPLGAFLIDLTNRLLLTINIEEKSVSPLN